MLEVVCLVFTAFKLPVVVTSAVEGPHGYESLHYNFRAIDIRKNFSEPEYDITWKCHAELILEAINGQFDLRRYPCLVINELDHIHFEWR